MNSLPLESEQTVLIPCGDFHLEGILHIPRQAQSLVLFAHGSGSSRLSSRNQFVARFLQEHRLATLLFDLLTLEEEKVDEETRALRFNIDLLASRLLTTTDWVQKHPELCKLPLGYFGASTGGAAAIVAAAERPQLVKAVVSRGGRPDLAGAALQKLKAPTLLIVGGNDTAVIELNQKAMASMKGKKELAIVPQATHLFEEPGALNQVAELAEDWFRKYR